MNTNRVLAGLYRVLAGLCCFFNGHRWKAEPMPGITYAMHRFTTRFPRRCLRCGKQDAGMPIPRPPSASREAA